MEEMQQITLDEWMSWKEDIRQKLKETTENFVYIGYRLRQIRDSGMFGGASDIFEFAQREYGLGKSTTSRFIAINEKFSNNSIELRPEFKAIGSSKLSEMLTLSDEECELITEHTTVKEIRELKAMNKEQEIEAAVEEFQLTPLQTCIEDYFRDKADALNALLPEIEAQNWSRCVDIMNPTGFGTHKKGIVMLFMYSEAMGAKCKTVGEGIRQYSWLELFTITYEIYKEIYEHSEDYGIHEAYLPDGSKDIHKMYYGAPKTEPKTEEEKPDEPAEVQGAGDSVATSQQTEETEPKSDIGKAIASIERAAFDHATNKNLVLHDVNTNIPLPDPQPEEEEPEEEVEEITEEQIPGQDTIEAHEERMPDKVSNRTELEQSGAESQQNGAEIVDFAAESEENEQKTEENEHFPMNAPTESATVRSYKGTITTNLNTLSQIWESGRPDKEKAELMKDVVEDLSWRLERMIDMIETEEEEDEE